MNEGFEMDFNELLYVEELKLKTDKEIHEEDLFDDVLTTN